MNKSDLIIKLYETKVEKHPTYSEIAKQVKVSKAYVGKVIKKYVSKQTTNTKRAR